MSRLFQKRKDSIERAQVAESELSELREKIEKDAPLAKAFGQWWADRKIENGIELDLRYDMARPRTSKGHA